MGEPSLLDYIKSKVRFWKRDERIEFPSESQLQPEISAPLPAALDVETSLASREIAPTASPIEKPVREVSHLPWRSLGALALALLGQAAWEPTSPRKFAVGLFFYTLSLGMVVWAALVREWELNPLSVENHPGSEIKIRLLPFILATIVAVLAFLTLGGNLFTPVNVTLWLLAIAGFVRAFWVWDETRKPAWQRLKSFLKRDSWQINFTWTTVLVLAVIALVVFFRLYNLRGVPSEPFSDHAEKILDVYDVSQGQTHIFFPRNTGREAIQMYLTLVVSWVFGTGLSFLSLKIGTVICGLLTLPYMYLLGKEFGGKRLALLAVFFTGIAYWPNVISRVGLRFPLYPLFVAPTFYYLLRGLRRRAVNDFIIAGLFLGFGLHGYSPFRIVPFVVVIAFGLYILHQQSQGSRKQAVTWLAIVVVVTLAVFLPLARYWVDDPLYFSMRAFSRLTGSETPLPGPAWKIFLSNVWIGLKMFNWYDGEVWVNSVPFRPALDVASGALFISGIILLLIRYIRQRHWQDLFILLSIPLLQLPSTLSLAYPAENPALNRAGGALVPALLLVAAALDALLSAISRKMGRRPAVALSWVVILFLGFISITQNYNLVFNQYSSEFTESAWNTSEMGNVIKQFEQTFGSPDNVWIVPYPYWVDTRLPGVWAGIPNRDFALWPQDFQSTLAVKGTKLIMLKTDDTVNLDALKQLYPTGIVSTFQSSTHIEGKNFLLFFIPPQE